MFYHMFTPISGGYHPWYIFFIHHAFDKNHIQPLTMGDSISICNTVNMFIVINVICILR